LFKSKIFVWVSSIITGLLALVHLWNIAVIPEQTAMGYVSVITAILVVSVLYGIVTGAIAYWIFNIIKFLSKKFTHD